MIQNRQARTKKQSGLAKKSDSFLDNTKPVSHGDGPQVYQVSELTRDIKAIMEAAFESIWVEGEISTLQPRHQAIVILYLRTKIHKFVVCYGKGTDQG